jgi:flagellar protein FlgJ
MKPPVVTDFAQFTQLRAQAHDRNPEALKQAAQQFEALFTQQLLKAAHSNPMGQDLLGGGSGGDMYKDMFDQQIAMHMASGKGLGLADMLVRQLQMQQGGAVPGAAAPVSAMKLAPRLHAAAAGAEPAAASPHSFKSPQEFVDAIRPHAEAAAKELGIQPHVLIAQAALETGWGRHLMRKSDGTPSFNFFGIKADKRWEAERSAHETTEYVNGDKQTQTAEFRDYDSIGASFADYVRFLKSNPRYAQALQHGGDSSRFAHGLQKAGYATDPAYASKLMHLARGMTLQTALAANPTTRTA